MSITADMVDTRHTIHYTLGTGIKVKRNWLAKNTKHKRKGTRIKVARIERV